VAAIVVATAPAASSGMNIRCLTRTVVLPQWLALSI
jgi:hypothetical protein